MLEELVEEAPRAGMLKKLLAEAHLDNAALRDLLSKNGDARCQAGRLHSIGVDCLQKRLDNVCENRNITA